MINTTLGQIKEKALIKTRWPVELRSGVTLVFSPLLSKYPQLVHAFTTRQGGKSKPPFDSFNLGINQTTDEEVHEDAYLNKNCLCEALHIPAEDLVTVNRQVHSADIVMLETEPSPGELDGIATSTFNKPVYMTFADCVPVIIYDSVKQVFCIVHAGWRGTAKAISQRAVEILVREYGSQVVDLVAAVGPAIGSCCYPVGLEVVTALSSRLAQAEFNEIAQEKANDKVWNYLQEMNLEGFFNCRDGQIHADLKAINGYQLLTAGVSSIDVSDFCTSCRADLFYSYRRSYVNNEGNTGRQAAVACLIRND